METFKLFPDQVKELKETQNAILRHYNPLVQAPAGSGKTFQMMALINWENARNGRVLYMVHRKEIIRQVEEKFARYGVKANVETVYWLQRTKNFIDGVTMLITDESHHSEAKGYKSIYKRYSQAIRVGYTATPARMDGRGFNDIYDKLITGPTVNQLIDKKRLSNFQLWGYDLGNRDALKRISGRDFSNRIIKEYFGNTKSRVIFGNILHSWETLAKDKQTIVYCYSVDFAKQIATMFNEAGYKAACVYSCKSAKEKRERAKNIADFESGKLQILTNYDVIGEGFDVTNCSCTVLLRPTMSLTVYIQQAMRSMRYQPGKTATVIDQVGNFMRFGRPDEEWDWSLESSPRFSLKGKPMLKSCPKCHATCPIQTANCPNCGHEFPIEKKHDELYDVVLNRIRKGYMFENKYIKAIKNLSGNRILVKNKYDNQEKTISRISALQTPLTIGAPYQTNRKSYSKVKGGYSAFINIHHKPYWVGIFETPVKAHRAAMEAYDSYYFIGDEDPYNHHQRVIESLKRDTAERMRIISRNQNNKGEIPYKNISKTTNGGYRLTLQIKRQKYYKRSFDLTTLLDYRDSIYAKNNIPKPNDRKEEKL